MGVGHDLHRTRPDLRGFGAGCDPQGTRGAPAVAAPESVDALVVDHQGAGVEAPSTGLRAPRCRTPDGVGGPRTAVGSPSAIPRPGGGADAPSNSPWRTLVNLDVAPRPRLAGSRHHLPVVALVAVPTCTACLAIWIDPRAETVRCSRIGAVSIFGGGPASLAPAGRLRCPTLNGDATVRTSTPSTTRWIISPSRRSVTRSPGEHLADLDLPGVRAQPASCR